MPNPVRLSVVVTDVELIETVLQRAQHSSGDGEITVTVQPTGSQRVPVNSASGEAGTARYKIIQGL